MLSRLNGTVRSLSSAASNGPARLARPPQQTTIAEANVLGVPVKRRSGSVWVRVSVSPFLTKKSGGSEKMDTESMRAAESTPVSPRSAMSKTSWAEPDAVGVYGKSTSLKPVTPLPAPIVNPPAVAVSGETLVAANDVLRVSCATWIGVPEPGSISRTRNVSLKVVDWVGNSLLRKLYLSRSTSAVPASTLNVWLSVLVVSPTEPVPVKIRAIPLPKLPLRILSTAPAFGEKIKGSGAAIEPRLPMTLPTPVTVQAHGNGPGGRVVPGGVTGGRVVPGGVTGGRVVPGGVTGGRVVPGGVT